MFPTKNKTINRWAAFLALIFILAFGSIWMRFVYLAHSKTVSGKDLLDVGKKQWTTVKLIDAQRGEILGRDGAVLAHDVPAYTVVAVLSKDAPSHVKNKEKTARELAPILHTDESTLLNYMQKDKFQVQFGSAGTKISYDQEQQIEKLKLPGIEFIKSSKRDYPNGSFASYLLGFTSQDPENDQQTGVYGLEKSLNSYLSETDGSIKFYSDSQGNLMPDGNQKIKKPKNGDNVTLTIDKNIQSVLEETMSQVQKDYDPKSMVGIVMDPKTGAILGMSSRPTFNPNQRDITNYYNNAISDPFEPGSVMKIFTLSAAVNEGVWNSNATYPSGTYTVDGTPIHDWNPNGWGTITFQQGLDRSSNVAFSRVENILLGPTKFKKYIKAFGLTQKTGIDLPNEQNSIVNLDNRVDSAEASFGQGSAFTPIQLVQAASAVANNGTMMKPYVVQKITNPDTNKVIKETKPTVAGHPITAATAKEVRDLLRGVVSNTSIGTGTAYNIPGYQVIGKTGTAQIWQNGHYLTGVDNYWFSFLGMAPQKNPKLIVYVAIKQPHLKQSENYSESAPIAKIFNPVMKTGLEYMSISPDGGTVNKGEQAKPEPTVKVGQWSGKSIAEAQTELENDGLKVVTLGSGNVTAQSITAGMKVFEGSQIILVGDGSISLPDLTNWSLNDVLSLCQLLDLQPKIEGNGFVVSQSIKPDTIVKNGDTLKVTLKSP
ncbi:penicillin-binding transpeptidase domain-containing protein [Pullulanibacillus sp. KACC 23026]|uniref:penicillin-binding transpeptidase domain-containing protein n=1 Tax=Pullulanibacillus sp. KACC 23026 TaxID=3028315 RepID=UPI0023AFA47F|nr:penicillin-binding transpeptidase domain-containing protein [Pullulanibacillus sp. KACC 23026]WEG11667.1 penicillin-binding transpeptidase domain-containing protein [Pullulanibacillus sp. KACC 23026]